MTSSTTPVKRVRIACLNCDNLTWHTVLQELNWAGGGDDELEYQESYQITQCQGCYQPSFRKVCRDESTNWQVEDEEVFPPRVVGRRRLPRMWLLPNTVRQIYREAHSARCYTLPVLTAVGIRSIVEAVCKEKGAAGGRLEVQIDDLVTKGVLTQSGADVLHATRFLGNKAAHEIDVPTPEVLDSALTVAEHLLQTVYLIPALAEQIKKKPGDVR